MYKFKPMQIVVDHRGEEVELVELDPLGKPKLDEKGEKIPAKGSVDGLMPLRHLLESALGDDPPQIGPTGQPMPAPAIPIEERRQRARLQTEMWAQGDAWEVMKDDGEYIVKRANDLLNTNAFGIVDRAWNKAIQEYENEQDAKKAAAESGDDQSPPVEDGAGEPPAEG